jgi:UDP-2,3-diacylglucosamine pyrophosphatase LpxH
MNTYYVGDLHIGDGSAVDNFKSNADKFRRFLQMVRDTHGVLYSLGDTFELWQCKLEDCLRYYPNICDWLILKSHLVLGNHDSQLGIPDRLIIGKTLLIHGHQFDKYNKGNAFWGKLITNLYTYIEPAFPKLQLLDRLWRDNEKYTAPLAELAKQIYCDTVIFQHTHVPINEFSYGIHFLNAGSWVEEYCHYVKCEDGIYTLNEWTE